ncbi:hypothetical protein ACFS07_19425 [Undibacterium arcticum]
MIAAQALRNAVIPVSFGGLAALLAFTSLDAPVIPHCTKKTIFIVTMPSTKKTQQSRSGLNNFFGAQPATHQIRGDDAVR